MILDYFTLMLHYNGIMDGHSGRRKYIGGTVLVYDNMEIDLFSVLRPCVRSWGFIITCNFTM
jgi:hypothetical protein